MDIRYKNKQGTKFYLWIQLNNTKVAKWNFDTISASAEVTEFGLLDSIIVYPDFTEIIKRLYKILITEYILFYKEIILLNGADSLSSGAGGDLV